jgi:sugar O-acyltransferase (sialic acid O-acetyltransferase NeuD family)
MSNEIILVGGGGHCKACIDVVETTNFKIRGVLDDANIKVPGYEQIGNVSDIRRFTGTDYFFLITIGQIRSAEIRKLVFRKIKEANCRPATVIAASAIVSRFSELGEGSIIMHQAIVNTASTIGKNCIINNKALIEHDCVIGDHTHVSTAAVINGNCTIGEGVFIGSNAVLVQGTKIADNVVVGAGSVVTKDITMPGIYAGNPIRKIDKD